MPHFSTSKHIALTADQAYEIAADVASYKDFVPLLKRSALRGDRKVAGAIVSFDADLMVAIEKLGLRESFTSHVVLQADKKIVTATSSDGPVKHMTTVWTISEAADGQANVAISLDYSLKNPMLQMLVSGLTEFAIQKIMHAFEARGHALYGKVLS